MVAGITQLDETRTGSAAEEPADQLIHFPRSDGNTGHRPTATMLDRRPGKLNYHRRVFVNEPAATGWRMKLGTALQRDLNLDPKKQWFLADWPKDYELFVHVNNDRRDLYLFGGPSKFRSANEFYPHARWLLLDPDLNKANCDCKYCGGTKFQRDINFREGLGPAPVSAPSASQASGKLRSNAAGAVKQANRAHVRRAAPAIPAFDPSSAEHIQINRDLEVDLRSRRWFRLGEIVWVRLDPSLQPHNAGDGETLEWWPAIVQETRLKVNTGDYKPGEDHPVGQTTVYRVRMLGLTTQYVLPERCLLPYQAHIPPNALIDRVFFTLQKADAPPNCAVTANFAPMPNPLKTSYASQHPSPPPTNDYPPIFESAAASFAFALQIAGQLATFWCATDNYEAILPNGTGGAIEQIRFQGLWWGPERIWIGDVVRIKPRRPQLVGNLLPPCSIEAQTRGLFLKISMIYLEDTVGPDGPYKEPMMAGSLYEVAEDDFVEPLPKDPPPLVASPSRSSPYHLSSSLPAPPPGHRLRQITPPGHEIHLSLNLLAGRYYPTLLDSPLISNVFSAAILLDYINSEGNLATVANPGIIPAMQNLLGLGGLTHGANSAIEATTWKEGRSPMFRLAWEQAKGELETFFREQFNRKRQDEEMADGEVKDAPALAGLLLPADAGLDMMDVKKEQKEVMLGPFAGMNLEGGYSEHDAIIID